MDLTPEEQKLVDDAGEANKNLALYLIANDRAATALKALSGIEAIADAIKGAVDEEDMEELISYLQD